MSKEDIKNSSRPFLYGIYKKYIERACENLGISQNNDIDQEVPLTEDDYPKEFTKISESKRSETANKWESDEDFLKQFSGFSSDKYENEQTFADHRIITV